MKLHIKLSLSILAGLFIIVLIAQYFQYNRADKLISDLSESTLSNFRAREEQAVRNLFRSVERAVSGSLERGEMEKFTKLLEAQNEVKGLEEFSLYNQEGIVTHSSKPKFLNQSLPEDLRERLLNTPEQVFRRVDNAMEIYQPQIVESDCVRCHKTWQVRDICGVTSMKFSTEKLSEAESHTLATRTQARQAFLMQSVITLAGITIVFMMTMYLSVSRFVRRPLSRVIEGLQDISEGEGDLTKRLEIASKDELGILARLFNTFVEKLQATVEKIQHSGFQVTSSSTELAATAKQQEVTIKTQVDSTNKVLKSVEEISTVTENLVETMQGVASITEETAESTGNEQTDLARMAEAMQHMENASRTISNRLQAINEKADNITNVVTTITKVADQTNLLSLNAAIEAEKAGEYGRGFTVVAREIRRLADQTAVATLDIERMVQEMQSAVASGVMEMDKFISEVQNSATDIMRISIKLSQIIQQVQALSPRFEEVNVSMTDLSDGMRQTSDSLSETFLAIGQLNEAARGLQDEVNQFKVG
jgi:methyl-accepting chemotaxis protein